MKALELAQGVVVHVTGPDGNVVRGQQFDVMAQVFNTGAEAITVDAVTLNVPPGESGERSVTGRVVFQVGAGPVEVLAKPDPLVIRQVLAHSADTAGNFRISLLELTRVIELFNTRNGSSRTGCYAVATTVTEDGFTADAARPSGDTVTLSRYHSADTDHNGKISLLELTRVIELFNTRAGSSRTGAYHAQTGTEDGYDPGP